MLKSSSKISLILVTSLSLLSCGSKSSSTSSSWDDAGDSYKAKTITRDSALHQDQANHHHYRNNHGIGYMPLVIPLASRSTYYSSQQQGPILPRVNRNFPTRYGSSTSPSGSYHSSSSEHSSSKSHSPSSRGGFGSSSSSRSSS